MENINISGNFNTAEREVEVVKTLLDRSGVEYTGVEKCEAADDGDVVVTAYGKRIIIEVKEEAYETRFSRYGQLGIDFLSVFRFKSGVNRAKWFGVKGPEMYGQLQNDVDSTNLKRGKLYYSKSHLWLFYSVYRGEFKYAQFFDGERIKSEEFKNYLFNNCSFAVNNKPADQLSYGDRYQSAVIYIDSNDAHLNEFCVRNLAEFIRSAHD